MNLRFQLREITMSRGIEKRQKPAWQKLRKPLPPPTKHHSTKKGKKGYNRKNKNWKKQTENDLSSE